MRNKLFNILGFTVIAIGLICVSFAIFQIFISETGVYPVLTVSRYIKALALFGGLGCIRAGFEIVKNSPFS